MKKSGSVESSAQYFRLLELHDRFNLGEKINKKKYAELCSVSEKTVERDMKFLNEYYESVDNDEKRIIKYNRKENVHIIQNRKSIGFNSSDSFAIAKILFESRAFSEGEMKRLVKVLANNNNDNINELIRNEEFHYIEPRHGKDIIDFIWRISTSISKRHMVKVEYKRQDNKEKEYMLKPVGLVFNEFYFYLLANIDGTEQRNPTVFRVDRFLKFEETNEKFYLPYRDRFEEGEFRKRIHFMYQGDLIKVRFKFWGSSIQAVYDRIPTAKKIGEEDGKTLIEAELYGQGIIMWFLSQREYLEVISPQSLREEMKNTITNLAKLYETV